MANSSKGNCWTYTPTMKPLASLLRIMHKHIQAAASAAGINRFHAFACPCKQSGPLHEAKTFCACLTEGLQRRAPPLAHSKDSSRANPSMAARPLSSSAVGLNGPTLLLSLAPFRMGTCTSTREANQSPVTSQSPHVDGTKNCAASINTSTD